MAEAQAGSTVPRRQLGRYLRDLRTKAGLTARAAARELERSEPTLWRIETGQVSVRSVEVGLMCRLYGADENLTRVLMALAKETKAKGWWQAYGDVVPEEFNLYVGLEAAAVKVSWYETELVPGLFQTEEYIRTLIKAHHPDIGAAELEGRVQLRLGRKAIIRRPIDPPGLRVAVRESVLRTAVGGHRVMAAQLDALTEYAALPNVALRVLPFSVGLHPGMVTNPFEILRFPINGGGAESEPPTVYSESFTGCLYLDKPHEVERYTWAFEKIWEASADEDSSADLIRRAAEGMRRGCGQ